MMHHTKPGCIQLAVNLYPILMVSSTPSLQSPKLPMAREHFLLLVAKTNSLSVRF